MQSNDRFLFGMVIFIVLLLGTSFLIAYTRPEPVYQPEDTPQGVVHNYLLALQNQDYERAYSYLNPLLKGYPKSVENFARAIKSHNWSFRNIKSTSFDVAPPTQDFKLVATIVVRELVFEQRGLFNSTETSGEFRVTLHKRQGQWLIATSEKYWLWCLDREEGCQ